MSNQDDSGTGEHPWPVAPPMSHDTSPEPTAPSAETPSAETPSAETPSVWAPKPARPDSSMTVRIESINLPVLDWPPADPVSTPAVAANPPFPSAPPVPALFGPPQQAPGPPAGDADRIVAWQAPVDAPFDARWTPPRAAEAEPISWAPVAPEHAAWADPVFSAEAGHTSATPPGIPAGVGGGWAPPPAAVSATSPPSQWSATPSAPPGIDIGLVTPTAPKRRRGKGALLGAGLGVVVLVGGGFFAARSLGGGEEPNTPQEAVQSMLDAVTKEDFIGVLESLSPAERDLFLDSGVPMIDELRRLGIFDEKLDLKKVSGVKVAFTNVRYSTEELRDDLAGVRITGGAYAVSGNPAKLPLGSFVKSVLTGDELADKDSQATGDLRVDVPIVALKDGKRWYVSLQYTIAHNVYAGRTGPRKRGSVPPKGGGVAANGAATPEAAVRDMMKAAADLDIRRMIELVPPDEMAALHDYSGYFIDDAVNGVADARKNYELTFPKIDLGVTTRGNTAFVTIKDIEIAGKLTNPDAESARSARYAESCLTIIIDTDSKKRCGRDIVKFIEDFGGQVGDTAQLDAIGSKSGKTPSTGIVAVKRDGRWYVSPVRTALDDLTNALKVIDRKDLEELRQQAADITNGMSTVSADDPNLSDSTFDASDTTVP